MRAVKRIACYLLLVWMTLLSTGGHAHGIFESSHHGSGHAPHETQHTPLLLSETLAEAVDGAAEVAHDACDHAHCGHPHGASLLRAHGFKLQLVSDGQIPAAPRVQLPSTPPNEIERPKWSLTTPRRGESVLT